MDTVIFIDGINDLLSTYPAETLGLHNFPTSFTTKRQHSGLNIDKKDVTSIDNVDIINSYLSQKEIISSMIQGLGKKCINILQPICEIKSSNHSPLTSRLIPKYGYLEYNIYNFYLKLLPYIQEIGEKRHGLIIDYLKDIENPIPLEFIDAAHMFLSGKISIITISKKIISMNNQNEF